MSQRANLIKARGLITFSSELDVPEGALVKATNINIDENSVITPRRGFNDFGLEFATETDRINQVMEYKNRVFRHFNSTLQYENDLGDFTSFSGTYNELIDGLRLKYKEVKGNFYFTTSSGIKKLSLKNASGLSSAAITNAGGIKAVDLDAKVLPTVGGYLPPQSKTAYRLVFGTKDKNGMLILGSPSARFILSNTSQDISIKEQSSLEFLLTGPADSDYFLLSTTGITYTFWFNVSGSATPPNTKTDTVGTTFHKIDLQTASSTAEMAALTVNSMLGSVAEFDITIDPVNASKAVMTSKVEGDIPNLQSGSSLLNVNTETNLNGSVTSGTSANASINFTLPQDITTDYFYQLYRTANITAIEGLTLNDLDPGDDMNLAYEAPITDADITAGEITVEENTPESFRASGVILYTSPNAGEGILQANEPPPIAQDIELFNNSTFYANTKSRHRSQINLLSVDDFISGTSEFIVSNKDIVRRYTFVGTPEESTITTDSTSNTTNSSSIIINSANNERKYTIYFDKSGKVYKPEFIDFTTDTLTVTDHPFKNDETVDYDGIKHYIVNSTANTIQLSETQGGSVITLNSSAYTVIRKSDNYTAVPETVDPINNIITSTAHSFVNNDEVLMENSVFYIVNSDANTFQILNQAVKELDDSKYIAASVGTEFTTSPDSIDFTDSEPYTNSNLDVVNVDCTTITANGHALFNEVEITMNGETYYVIDRTITTYRVSKSKNEIPSEGFIITRSSDDYVITPESVNFTSNLFNFTAHGFSNDDIVSMDNRIFYVRDKLANSFKLSSSIGGSVYDIEPNNYKIEKGASFVTPLVMDFENNSIQTNEVIATEGLYDNDVVTLNGITYLTEVTGASELTLVYTPVEIDDTPFTVKRLSDDHTASPEIVDFDTNIVTTSAHSFLDEDKVIMDNSVYYIANSDTNNIQFSEIEAPSIEKSEFYTSFLTEQPVVENTLYTRINLAQYDDSPAGTVEAISDAFIGNFDFIVDNNDTDNSIPVGDIKFTTVNNGNADDVVFGPINPTGLWSIGTIVDGTGETFDTAEGGDVLLSGLLSVSQTIDETARSLVKTINRDSQSPVNAFYLSSDTDLPGIILIENKSLEDIDFFLAVNDTAMQGEFSPKMPVQEFITEIDFLSGSNTPAKIEYLNHGLSTGDEIYLYSPDTIPSIVGKQVITYEDDDHFTVPVNITTNDLTPTSAFYFITDVESDNVETPNRLYYSKLDQPEAVPITNYIDIGPKDEPIERVIALMDNLVVFKTDGVYLVYGSSAPNFSARLLDNSVSILAPDSAVVLNNKIYCLTTQGISTVSNSVQIMSRPIENLINKVVNARYDYKYKTFGVAYENDRAYVIWLPTEVEDEVATQAYRFNTFERGWTRWDIPATCGLVKSIDDKMYIGDGTRNYLLQERKEGDRTDFSDRNFTLTIDDNMVNDNLIELSSVTNVTIGDVLVQRQTITVDFFNRFLRKLDIDTGLQGPDAGTTTYEAKHIMIAGNNITTSLNVLNIDLVADDDSGTITPRLFNSDFIILQTEFNLMIDEINSSLCDSNLKNYRSSFDTIPFETLITNKNTIDNEVTVILSRNFISGPIEVYKGISSEIQWSPQAFGDPSAMKQMRESSIIFDQNNFYSASLSFSSDVSADFTTIQFLGKGPGYWGDIGFGNPGYYWGGNGNDIPFRTLVPIEKQRARYLNVKFNHINAREIWRIIGVSAVVRAISSRAYR